MIRAIASRAAHAAVPALAVTLLIGRPPVAHGQVLTAQYGPGRTGATLTETTLAPGNVNASTFGKIATFVVDGDVYTQPLFVPRVTLRPGLTRDVLIVATESGSVYALDASARDLTPLWRRQLVDAAAGVTPLSWSDVRCPFIRPDISITPTPVIDPVEGTVYVLVRTKERGAGAASRYVQRLHALDLRTGADRRPPAEIRATASGTGAGSRDGRIDFDPLRENPRAALLLVRGVVYLAWASSCDVGPYHGWIMAYDASTLGQLAVLNTSPNGSEAGIWQGDAGLAADSSGNVYAVTGNGTFDVNARDYGNTILKLALTGKELVVRDYFTPSNEAELSRQDADLGSSGPILLPSDAATGGHPLLFVTGKDGLSYLVDQGAMSHFRAGSNPHARQTIQTSSGGFGASAYWNHTLYVWGSHTTLKAYTVADGRLTTPPRIGPTTTADPGAMPVVSANGLTNGIVWAVETHTWRGADKPAVLHAYDALDVRHELYSSETNALRDRAGPATRFAVPTVAAGHVFLAGRREVDVYGLLGPRR